MIRVVRVLSVAVAAAVCVTCADQAVSEHGRVRYARVPLAPLFAVAPVGGPRVNVKHIHGVLRSATDSTVADALVFGDSAILEFENVVVHGDSSPFHLGVQAFDSNDVVFTGEQDLKVKPGDNAPANLTLNYAAPDSAAASIKISVTALLLDWAGADTANHSCLNRSLKTPRTTQQALTVTGKKSDGTAVANVRVGWTSGDTTVFTVDSTGLVKARCSNKSAKLFARTFLDKADSIVVTVIAPPFSLVMTPDSASVERGKTRQDTAWVIDENNNKSIATSVKWSASDITRATVDSTGLVTAISNGRVLITAGTGGRTTVGVVQVVRPKASKVVIQAVADSIGKGQSRAFFAKALDAADRVIPEATGFVWSTTAAANVLTMNSTTGVATAVGLGTALLTVTLDGKQATVSLKVLDAMPAGGIKGKVTDASTGLPLSGVVVNSSATNTATTIADGSYTLGGLQDGDDITVTKTGYVTITAYSVPVFPNKTVEVPAVPMSPTGSTGTMTGKVVNALSGNVVSGITVMAYAGINAGPTPKRPSVTPNFTVSTDAGGIFTISSAPAGVYTLLFSGTGYSDAISGANSVGGTTKTTKDVLLPPAAVGGGLYIILTWGLCGQTNVPCDLDAHLTGPKVAPDTGRFQVFHGSLRYALAPDTIAALDVDDVSGPGPEIIGLRPSAGVGLYHFYVHNFSGAAAPTSKALADSAAARVDVYQDSHLIGTFFPPAGAAGTLWRVFDYDGARLIPVGDIVNPADPAVLAIRAADKPKLPIRK